MADPLPDLKSLVEFASAQAVKIFRRTRVIYPMYHAIRTNGEMTLLTPPPGDKDLGVAIVKAWLTLENIDRYVFMDEGWILDRRTGRPEITPGEMERIRREGLRNHPDARECVMFNAENRRGEMLTARHFILRPEHGKPSLSPLVIDDMTGIESQGRMVGLFNWEN